MEQLDVYLQRETLQHKAHECTPHIDGSACALRLMSALLPPTSTAEAGQPLPKGKEQTIESERLLRALQRAAAKSFAPALAPQIAVAKGVKRCRADGGADDLQEGTHDSTTFSNSDACCGLSSTRQEMQCVAEQIHLHMCRRVSFLLSWYRMIR